MNCLALIKFIDAVGQPIQGLAHQLWVESLLISDNVTDGNGISVWFKRPVGTIVDIRIKNKTTSIYESKAKIKLIGEKTIFGVRSPKLLLKGVGLSIQDVGTGNYRRSTYLVAEGDYLSRIAIDNNVDIEVLKKLNNLPENGAIRAGQVLKLPITAIETDSAPDKSSNQPSNLVYVVKKNDNLSTLQKVIRLQ